MAAATVMCAKLGKELPAIDPDSFEGARALRMVTLIGGPALRSKVLASVSAQAWKQWEDHMVMIFNEYRLDPTSDQSNKILGGHLDSFFFGQQKPIDNWVPPTA